jgi:hypothetical protein
LFRFKNETKEKAAGLKTVLPNRQKGEKRFE